MVPTAGQGASLSSLPTLARGLLALGAITVLAATGAQAQNLDQGKPPAKLFADGCAACHRSPRGLAKGHFSLTLYMFLKEHYATGPDEASALAAYLQSVDGGPREKSRRRARGPHSARTSPRPGAPPPASPPKR